MPHHLDGGLTDVRRGARVLLGLVLCLAIAGCSDDDDDDDGGLGPSGSEELPTHDELFAALDAVVGNPPAGNGGLSLNMWATIVDRSGIVRAIAFTGTRTGDQWPGSRVISAQKANTANAFSLTGLRPLHGEPLHRHPAGRQPLRPAGEQPGEHRGGLRRQRRRLRHRERFHARQADRRGERVRRRAGAL